VAMQGCMVLLRLQYSWTTTRIKVCTGAGTCALSARREHMAGSCVTILAPST
jgi:hypothetical protein